MSEEKLVSNVIADMNDNLVAKHEDLADMLFGITRQLYVANVFAAMKQFGCDEGKATEKVIALSNSISFDKPDDDVQEITTGEVDWDLGEQDASEDEDVDEPEEDDDEDIPEVENEANDDEIDEDVEDEEDDDDDYYDSDDDDEDDDNYDRRDWDD